MFAEVIRLNAQKLRKAVQSRDWKTVADAQVHIDEVMCQWARAHAPAIGAVHELWRVVLANNRL